MARLGIEGLRSARRLAQSLFTGERARAPPEGDALAKDLPDDPVRLDLEGVVHTAEPPAGGSTTFLLDVARVRDGTGDRAVAVFVVRARRFCRPVVEARR